jgi:2-polyprenyl-3-methyl-5-hydroxy-6-metoxy-1,4-benzoquinol methylase
MSGGYDDGYSRCACFWGKTAGSLVRSFISSRRNLKGYNVLDLGAGEGKNSYACARAGAWVVAVDCSAVALKNGQRAFPHDRIRWIKADAEEALQNSQPVDVVIMYGLLHCLRSQQSISSLIELALSRTKAGGHHIVAAFNDGPHDLAAHPELTPTLVSHDFYLSQYGEHEILSATNEMLRETHPHNCIPHFHSMTRLLARKSQ